MAKETSAKKGGLGNRMEDFFFEIVSPDGKKVEISNDKPKNMKNKEKM
jgi:hypothetical protein